MILCFVRTNKKVLEDGLPCVATSVAKSEGWCRETELNPPTPCVATEDRPLLRTKEDSFYRKCVFVKALPEADFRYFSKSIAVVSLWKAKYACKAQGLYFEAYTDSPLLWASSR